MMNMKEFHQDRPVFDTAMSILFRLSRTTNPAMTWHQSDGGADAREKGEEADGLGVFRRRSG